MLRIYETISRQAFSIQLRRCVAQGPTVDKEVYKNIDPKSSEVYRLANQFRKENANVVGDKPVKNDAGEMSMNDDSKRKAW